jgi:hypothetical protein
LRETVGRKELAGNWQALTLSILFPGKATVEILKAYQRLMKKVVCKLKYRGNNEPTVILKNN